MIIKPLVHRYTDRNSKPWSADYIENEGNGQIFLLHGSPGVGKTFTAECIAEQTGKPLFALTCGDIGINEVEMERTLEKWLDLGHKRGALVLIDEADVFLEKRANSDLKRISFSMLVFVEQGAEFQDVLDLVIFFKLDTKDLALVGDKNHKVGQHDVIANNPDFLTDYTIRLQLVGGVRSLLVISPGNDKAIPNATFTNGGFKACTNLP
ncbi:hypothetical protein PspLS_10843 [Pyricularia sp. CBS 133598]|nr:hypothetical protein PspLS_10843 [Pyricularia sp. CBS 133598]